MCVWGVCATISTRNIILTLLSFSFFFLARIQIPRHDTRLEEACAQCAVAVESRDGEWQVDASVCLYNLQIKCRQPKKC